MFETHRLSRIACRPSIFSSMSSISSNIPCSSNPNSGTTASLDCSSNPRHACEKLAWSLGMPQDEEALSSSGRSMAPARPTTIQRQPGLHRPPCAAKRPSLWLLGRPLAGKPTSAAWSRTPARVPTSARAKLCQLSRECDQLANRPVGIYPIWSMDTDHTAFIRAAGTKRQHRSRRLHLLR